MVQRAPPVCHSHPVERIRLTLETAPISNYIYPNLDIPSAHFARTPRRDQSRSSASSTLGSMSRCWRDVTLDSRFGSMDRDAT